MTRRLILLTSLFLAGCTSRSDLPAITDPGSLRADGDVLLKEGEDSFNQGDWPSSVKALHPVSVLRDKQALYITTFAQTGLGARGYVLAREKPKSSLHYKISDISIKGIYRFDFKL